MNISKILSIAFAPQITPIYWFVILYFKNVKATNNLYSTLIAITFAAAFEIVALLVYATKSKDFFVTERQKRMPLFIVSMLSYFVGTVLLKLYNAPFVIYALMLSYLINTIIAALITKYYSKISIHTWGISGPAVTILYAYGAVAFTAMLVLAFIVGLSRVKMNAHTIQQVTYALLLSLIITVVVVYVIAPINF